MIGFIGVGNMASAIINGILKKNLYFENEITIYDNDSTKYQKFNIKPSESIVNLCTQSDLVFLCVKPQVYNAVLDEIGKNIAPDILSQKTFVSIAAGISTSHICKKLKTQSPVIRVMPNTPLLIGEGASALTCNDYVDKQVFSNVVEIFSALGVTKILDEEMMNRIISVNGSSPAYVYLFAKAMCEGAKAQGIDDDVLPLVVQSIIGSAKMMAQTCMTPDELIKMVTSPGGTTLAALNSFESDDFCGVIKRAMQKCTDRAEEIAAETQKN